MRTAPPFFARLLLRALPQPAREHIVGDLVEEYASRILPARGRLRAALWFWGQTLRSLGAFVRQPGPGLQDTSSSAGTLEPNPGTEAGTLGPNPGTAAGTSGPNRRTAPPPARPTLSELRSALRVLTREPGFAAVTVLTLGIGLGGAISVFSVAHQILYRPLPGVDEPGRLAVVELLAPDGDDTGTSYPNLRDLEAGAPAVERLAGSALMVLQAAGTGLEPSILWGEAVTPGYFEILGVTAHQGRLFSTSEPAPGAVAAVTVLSHDAWTDAFGADPQVVGRTLRLNGQAFTIIGVAERGFAGIDRLRPFDLWVPASMYSGLHRLPPEYALDARDFDLFGSTIMRLAPGTTAGTAEQQLRQVAERIVDTHGEDAGSLVSYRPHVSSGVGLGIGQKARLHRMTTLFYGVVSIILLIACANVANLLLVRGTRRQGVTAVRRALGASRSRIIGHHLAESLALALPAAGAGLVIAAGLNRAFWLGGFLPYTPIERLALDHRVVGFAFVLGIGTTLLFGIVPAVFASGVDVAAHLRGDRFGTRRIAFVREGLSVLQLALSLALLVGAALLGRTLWNLQEVDVGFEPGGVMSHYVDLAPQGYSDNESLRFLDELVARVRRLPFVQTASITAHPPFSGASISFGVRPPGASEDAASLQTTVQFVADDYFATLTVPVLRGRIFRPSEIRANGDLVVLGDTTARRLFGERNPVGAVITASTFTGRRTFRIIGVVGDVRTRELRESQEPTMYLPFRENSSGAGSLLVKSSAAPERVSRAVQDVVLQLDTNVPVYRSESLSELVARRSSDERTLLRLLAVLAVLAITLAAVGLHAVVAHTVAQRTREIGVRVALGADAARIVRMVVWHAALVGVVGVGLGLAASAALARVLESYLYGVDPLDPLALGGAALFLELVVLAAGALPARSAARVDAVTALRRD